MAIALVQCAILGGTFNPRLSDVLTPLFWCLQHDRDVIAVGYVASIKHCAAAHRRPERAHRWRSAQAAAPKRYGGCNANCPA